MAHTSRGDELMCATVPRESSLILRIRTPYLRLDNWLGFRLCVLAEPEPAVGGDRGDERPCHDNGDGIVDCLTRLRRGWLQLSVRRGPPHPSTVPNPGWVDMRAIVPVPKVTFAGIDRRPFGTPQQRSWGGRWCWEIHVGSLWLTRRLASAREPVLAN